MITSAYGQNETLPYVDYEVKPLFQGEPPTAFQKWVHERIVFDPQAKAEGVQGRVMVTFTIEPDGTLDKVNVLRGVDPRLDAEAVRVVSSSPKWDWPSGNVVPIRYTLPVFFESDIPNPYPCEEFQYGDRDSEVAKIYCISHGSIAISIWNTCIFIDPVMRLGEDEHKYGWFRSALYKAILLTHEHGDHFSKETIAYLTEGMKPENLEIFGNEKCIEQLGEGVVLKNGDSAQLDESHNIKITVVPAYNTSKGHKKFHPEGNGNGYLIEVGDLMIYVAGDTEPIREMKHLGKVDIAFLPVNQPYTMTPKQCIKAAKAIKPRVLIPYHMGNTDMTEVIKYFDNTATQVIFHEELR